MVGKITVLGTEDHPTTALLKAIGDLSSDAIYAKDLNGRFIYANPTVLRVIGKSADDVLGHTDADLHSDPEQAATVMANDRRIMQTRIPEVIEEIWDTPDQGTRTFRSTKAPLCVGNGSVIGIVCVSADITSIKAANQKLARVYDTAPVGLCFIDRDLRFVMINKYLASVNGISVEAHIGRTLSEVLGDFGRRLEALYKQVLDTGEPIFEREFSTESQEDDFFSRHWLLSLYPFEDHAGNITGVNATVSEITEQKRAENALKIAKAEGDRALLARSKFLATASHDLRQPVQALVLLLAVIKNPKAGAETVEKAVGMMESALVGLQSLLTSILDISRVDAGVVAPQLESVAVDGMLRRLCDGYTLECEQKNLRLRCRFQPDLHARTDAALLERILRNLIENAIRYTDRGGLLIGARQRGDRIRIDIVDSGVGVPADKLTHIFEEFYQVANPGRDQRQGLGLGLAIVSRLVRLIGADLQVRSREGRGTWFTLTVPIADPLFVVSAPSAAAETVTGRRIMVIEDDPKVRAGLELLLGSWNCEVIGVESGEEAIEVGEREGWRFDLVIADHRLGAGLSGTETAIEIAARAGRTIPTLIVTGDTAPERISQVYTSGFEMLHKPVNPHELARKLATLLRS
ncbi:PAS domain S-box-containing protein [Rhodoblastus acidophilus]|uniref:PAS domain-containing hybrid sensor histidine kinase/response regulator n=1 Tax=Rhodoblastus acidophilus TaxID=1074 RepID=UPI002224C3F1|nr:PAS domain-containing hybrid sensor histidine kinase/response regulator [Rhodoblastus acidophilus]MCW2285615.1 PAS domain S-box-containing protein [Rhodoblastus acidophilus]MCW2334627.1 PAS domain S-box-containing protein [Rhodoblastus acidophilus]